MFTTTDCKCHNLTMFLPYHWNTCKIWMDYWLFFHKWLTEQDWECEWNQGKGWVSTSCVKRVVFKDGWCVVYVVKGYQSFKNGPFWSPPGSPPRSLPWPLALHVVNERSMKMQLPNALWDHNQQIWRTVYCWESFVPDFIWFCHLWN